MWKIPEYHHLEVVLDWWLDKFNQILWIEQKYTF